MPHFAIFNLGLKVLDPAILATVDNSLRSDAAKAGDITAIGSI